jgi:hypothetical protein
MLNLDSMLKDIGVSLPQREKLRSAVRASNRDEVIVKKLRQALQAAGVSSALHDKAIDEMESAGLFPQRAVTVGSVAAATDDTDSVIGRIEAAAAQPGKRPELERALGLLKRFDIQASALSNMASLNDELSARNVPNDDRFALKILLGRLSIL